MSIVSLDHVNIRTAELARTTAFFTEVLGLEVGWRPDFPFAGAWLYASGKDLVHLVEVPRPPAASAGSALDHFAFAIDDYEAAEQALLARGMAFQPSVSPDGGIRQMFVTEMNGVTIELNFRSRRHGA